MSWELALTILILVGPALAANRTHPGEELSSQIRYQHGTESENLPFIGALARDKNVLGVTSLKPFCTATVISANRILTAAHCLDSNAFASAPKFYFIWGLTDLRSSSNINWNSPSVQKIEFTQSDAVIHRDYNDKKYINDIGIIRLKKPLDLAKGVKPICLAKSERTSGLMGAGFGLKTCLGNSGGRLTSAQGTYVDRNACTRINLKVTDSQVCSRFHNSLGSPAAAASGDSGGPLFSNDGTGPVQVGILSLSPALPLKIPGVWTCFISSVPAVATRIASFQDFIKEHAIDAKFC